MKDVSRRTFLRRMVVGGATVTWAFTGIDFAHAAGSETFTLRIIHTNDHHARIEPVLNGTALLHGGVSRRKTMIDAIRAQGGNQLLLDAGDVFQGTLYFNQYHGLADLEFYNAMGYEAMTIGNHEFDIGQQPLADFIKGTKFPVLSANLIIDPTSPLAGLVKPYIVKWVDGQPIGIFGLTTEETTVLSTPGTGVAFADPVSTARWVVEDLHKRGVRKIIALTHIGNTFDIDLARKVDGISAIIGGHSHTPLGPQNGGKTDAPYPEVVASPSGNPVIVATDWEWGRWLGDLTLGFDDAGKITRVVAGRTTEVLPSITPNKGFEDRIATLRAPIAALRATQVGVSNVVLNGLRTDVRSKETNLGNLSADATLAKTAAAGSQIAIVNGGGIRTSIDQGPVTLGEVLEVFPFGNTLVVMDVTGAQVKEALENGVSQVETQAGRFPQVGGMRYTWNPTAAVNSRITKIEIADGKGGFAPISPTATYRLVVNNFMATGGDGYSVLQKGTKRLDTGFLDSDTLAEYIRAKSPVSIGVEGRITSTTTAALKVAEPEFVLA